MKSLLLRCFPSRLGALSHHHIPLLSVSLSLSLSLSRRRPHTPKAARCSLAFGPRLAVARYTLGCASGTELLSPLSRVRASSWSLLSLATPLATPRVQCCSLSSLEFEPRSEASDERLAVARHTLGLAAPRAQSCSLRSLDFEPRSDTRCRSLRPWVQCCVLRSLDF